MEGEKVVNFSVVAEAGLSWGIRWEGSTKAIHVLAAGWNLLGVATAKSWDQFMTALQAMK